MKRRHSCSGRRGFTIIELLVVIAIAATLMVVGVPSFVSFQRNSELTSTTNSLVAALSAARGEAMKRGLSAVVVPATGDDWTTGWVVFIDADNDQALDTSESVIAKQGALASYFTATGEGTAKDSPPYIMFDPSGYTKTKAATFRALTLTIARNDLTGTAKTEQTRIVVISKTGRARTCRPAADTTCTASATE
ncbi:MAG: prepilin-type N-terminal cleavage/methylation domain-containing protein [Alcaligenaceae bacterium]|nr:MAG: prepilin-type N-terminal cleavage/methylation domain-containing protein [Alcaligenaceae bacterium]